MEVRKLNSPQQGKVIYVQVPIVNQQSNEERAVVEFCEDLRNLAEVSEVRGCSQRRIGQAMIGCGLQTLQEGCSDPHTALHMARTMLDGWEELVVLEEEQ